MLTINIGQIKSRVPFISIECTIESNLFVVLHSLISDLSSQQQNCVFSTKLKMTIKKCLLCKKGFSCLLKINTSSGESATNLCNLLKIATNPMKVATKCDTSELSQKPNTCLN